MKCIAKIGLIASISFALNSCVKEEPFPIEPAIKYLGFVYNTDGSATLKYSFTDGDGDIGIEQDESGYNYYIHYYNKDVNGDFVPYVMPPDTNPMIVPYRIMPIYNINPGKKKKSSKGEIWITLYEPIFPAGETMKVACQLFDQAGHSSSLEFSPVLYP